MLNNVKINSVFSAIFLILSFCTFNAYSFDGNVVYVSIENHRFVPEKIYAESGKKIKLVVYNKDEEVEEFESHDLNRERIVPANSTINIILAPLEVGEYKFFGDFHQDTANGVLIIYDKNDSSDDELNG